MASYDSVQSPAPPDLRPPQVDFSPIADIGNSYLKGVEQKRQFDIRDAFKGGLPTDASGQPDYNAMAQKLFRLGDFGDAQSVMKTGYAMQELQKPEQASPFTSGGAQPQAAPSMAPQRVPAQAPAAQAPASYSGGDNGQTTVASVVQGAITDPAQAGPAIVRVAGALGIDPNQPLSAEQMTAVKGAVGRLTGATAQAAPAAPAAAAGPATAAPAAPQSNPAIDALVPPQFQGRAREYADTLSDAANRLRQQAQRQGLLGLNTKALEDRASQYDAVSSKVREALAPTSEEKNLGNGAARDTELQKLAIDNGEKQYRGIEAQASQYERDLKPMLGLSEKILNDPAMYTGVGAQRVLDFNRIKAAFGDNRAAALQEMLKKVTATSALSQVNVQRDQIQEAAGPGGGRIFKDQIDLISQSIPTLEGTMQGNRALVEIQKRMGQVSQEVHKQAIEYRRDHKYLDDGFHTQVSAYLDKHPLMTPLEQAHPDLLGAPTSPFPDVARTQAWAKQMGLNKGDAFRTSTGQIKAVP